jgi:hypothetical protein
VPDPITWTASGSPRDQGRRTPMGKCRTPAYAYRTTGQGPGPPRIQTGPPSAGSRDPGTKNTQALIKARWGPEPTRVRTIPCTLLLPTQAVIGRGVPDLPSGEDNYRFGGDVTQTIRLPINTTRTPQSQHHFSSGYQPCAARLTSPRRLILACESKTQARTRKNTI